MLKLKMFYFEYQKKEFFLYEMQTLDNAALLLISWRYTDEKIHRNMLQNLNSYLH